MNLTKGFVFLITLLSLLNISCIGKKSTKQLNILVTAPIIYNSRLSSIIDGIDNGTRYKAIKFPMIDTELIENNTAIDTILLHLDHFSWIALTSRNAIKAYFQRAKELGIKKANLKNCYYCAIGKDQEYLKSFGINNILTNREPSPQGIVNALRTIPHTNQNIAVLCPQVIGLAEPDIVPNFLDSLRSIGFNVSKIHAYITSIHRSKSTEDIVNKIKTGEIDLIAFTSSAEIEGLLSIIHHDKSMLKNINIACFGPYTKNNAIRLGLHPCLTASNFSSFNKYVEAINNFYKIN